MHDRVSDVLRDRAGLASNVPAAIALSMILHVAAGGIALFMAQRRTIPAAATVLNIRLAAPVAAPSPASVPRRTRIEEPKPKAPEPLVPAVPQPVAAPDPKTVPLSPFGRSDRKGSEKPPAATPPAAPSVSEGGITAASIPVGGTGVTAIEGAEFPYAVYIDRMQTLVGSRWLRPQIAAGSAVTVRFTVERDGRIRDATIETGSGSGIFDRAALRAVMESSPLPPLPFAYTGTSLGVHLTFR